MSALLKLALVSVFISMTFAMEQPCCYSKKYFAIMKIVTMIWDNGTNIPVLTDNRQEMDYDYDMKMERVRSSVYKDDGNTQTFSRYSLYNDFTNMKSYQLSSDMQTCSVQIIVKDMPPHCVPSTLPWTATYTFGSGSEALRVNSWDGMIGNLIYSMQTTVNDCTPVSLTVYGITPEGDRISKSVLYANVMQNQVRSDDVFKIPDLCMTVGIPVGK